MAPTIGGVSKNGMKRADANKPIIYDSMRGEKYVQQRFLGKVRALELPRAKRRTLPHSPAYALRARSAPPAQPLSRPAPARRAASGRATR